MKAAAKLFAGLIATAVGKSNNNQILPPQDSKADLPEKMLVLIPGADVDTGYYKDTAKAIQEAADLKLWVVIPEIADKFCISVCSTASLCGHLQTDVSKVIGMAKDQGYTGPLVGEGVFMSGHSLGSTCADNLVRGFTGQY